MLAAAGGLEPDQARQLYQVWISFNKTHPLLFIAHFNCSTLLQQIGDEQGGEAELRASLALKPDFAPAGINLGSSLERQGKVNEAIDQWRGALDLMSAVTADSINYKVTLLKQISRVLSDSQSACRGRSGADAMSRTCAGRTRCRRAVCRRAPVAMQMADDAGARQVLAPYAGLAPSPAVGLRLHRRSAVSSSPPADKYVRTMAPIEDRTTRFDRRSAPIETNRRLRIGYVSSDLRHHASAT